MQALLVGENAEISENCKEGKCHSTSQTKDNY